MYGRTMMYHELIGDDDASTPLTTEELEDLKLSYITNRDELNEAEQRNITKAFQWAPKSRLDLFSDTFLKTLHKNMFGDVWKWAGKYRQSPRNIGIDAYRIPIEIRSLFEDVTFWIENMTFSPIETGTRFHHKLVFIHPFPNGNGRCSRFMTDLVMKRSYNQVFTWGKQYEDIQKRRNVYIKALRAADNHDFELLNQFVKNQKIIK